MSALKRIRENVGLVIIIIAISLFAFIFSSLVQSIGPGSDNSVAEVNGTSVPYEALNAKLESIQRSNPGANTSEDQYQQRNQAWNNLISELILGREFEAAGIGITDDERMMLFTGPLFSPRVVNSGYFADSLSKFNPARVPEVFKFADQIEFNDPQIPDEYKLFKLGLLELRDDVSRERLANKWQAAVAASGMVSDNEAKLAYEQGARTANISYVYVPFGSIPDQQLEVTDADRNEYYNKHREAHRRDDEVRFNYGYFPIRPSNRDSADAREDVAKIKREFLLSEEPFAFAFTNTDAQSLDTNAMPLSMLPAALSGIGGRTDTVVGPIRSEAGFEVFRIVKVEEDSVNSNVELRHVLVRLKGATAEDSAAAKQSANEIRNQILADKSKFESIVLEKSDDQNTKMNGGSLGWVPENAFGEPFTKDIKAARVGDVIVTSSAQGYHVVELQDRSNKLYAYASILRNVSASTATRDSIFQRASGYLSDVVSGTEMSEAATKYGEMRLSNSGNIGPGTYSLLGLEGARPVVTWAFSNEQGKITDQVIETENAFVIAKVEYKGEKGYAAVGDLKDNLEFENGVRNYVKAKQIKAKLNGSDLSAIASSYGAGAREGAANGLRFNSNEVQGIGPEPKVVGRAFGLQPNQVSKPIVGKSGVFVIRLDSKVEPAPMDEMSKMVQLSTLKNAKGSKIVNALFNGMVEIADIRDYRYRVEF